MWFAYTIIGVLLLVLFFMPKKLTLKEIYYSVGILGFGAWLGDALVGDVFKGFQIGPSPNTYLIDYIFVSFVPLALGLIYLNFLTEIKSIAFKWVWAAIAYLLEWGAVASGYMVNKGWKTWYSIPVYVLVFVFLLPWHLKFMRSEK